ncbi:hypothetical protein [Jiulongibacter sediminis]|jgi:hypothetical protein|uniref:hypothetical protein n=1 Tax=Jiulongibacter sediminis TaxID=1605367 RepID=UPI0026F0484A|nr:hypothetical protein [Jiulongibacter sediminis]
MEKQLTDNLYISNEAVEILDFLADQKITPATFGKNQTISHIDGVDQYLILFIKREEKDEFIKFTFKDFTTNPDSMFYLLNVLKNLAKEDYQMFNPAQRKLEEMIHMRPVFHAYYYPKATA